MPTGSLQKFLPEIDLEPGKDLYLGRKFYAKPQIQGLRISQGRCRRFFAKGLSVWPGNRGGHAAIFWDLVGWIATVLACLT